LTNCYIDEIPERFKECYFIGAGDTYIYLRTYSGSYDGKQVFICEDEYGSPHFKVKVYCKKNRFLTPLYAEIELGTKKKLQIKGNKLLITGRYLPDPHQHTFSENLTFGLGCFLRVATLLPPVDGAATRFNFLNMTHTDRMTEVEGYFMDKTETTVAGKKLEGYEYIYRRGDLEQTVILDQNRRILKVWTGADEESAIVLATEEEVKRRREKAKERIDRRLGKLKCEHNLRLLHQAVFEYFLEYTRYPAGTGKEFFKNLGSKVDIKESLHCPSSGREKGGICYRGPAEEWNKMLADKKREYLFCDDPQNHPDGINALTKAGRVEWLKKGTKEYKKALADTKE
jgi:hypothetical protein